MANLDALEQEVAELSQGDSTPFDFRDVYNDLEAAVLSTSASESQRLANIVGSFRGKLPGLIILQPIRAKAKDLHDFLTEFTINEAINRINVRNETLSTLTSALDEEIEKANKDATLLTRIKDGVEKATKTVEEIRGLINDLTATDASTRERLTALIERLGNLSNILHPEEV
jgi:hypothetical protein